MSEAETKKEKLSADQKLQLREQRLRQEEMKHNNAVAIRKENESFAVSQHGAGMALMPQTFSQMMTFTKAMSMAGAMIGKPFRNEPELCMGITMQAMQWNMNPFQVSQKAYVVSSKMNPEPVIAYEAQLLSAVILANAPHTQRPRYEMIGEKGDRQCKITWFPTKGDDIVFTGAKIGSITTKNSPLWKSDPDQQLRYHTVRSFARVHFPDILMGAYTKEEMDEVVDPTPKPNITDHLPGGAKQDDEAFVVEATYVDMPEDEPESPIESDKEIEDAEVIEDEKQPDTASEADIDPIEDVKEPDDAPQTEDEAEEDKMEARELLVDQALSKELTEWLEYLKEADDADIISEVFIAEIDMEWRKALTKSQNEFITKATNTRIKELKDEKG